MLMPFDLLHLFRFRPNWPRWRTFSTGHQVLLPTTCILENRIDLQEILLHQIEMLHKMSECGALNREQFEQRRDSILTQLDSLSDE